MAMSIGVVALATGGPILRPDVRLSAADAAIALSIGVAIGWPLLTARGTLVAIVAGQGAIALAITAAARESNVRDATFALAIWITTAFSLALPQMGVRYSMVRGRAGWATVLAAATAGSAFVLGKR